MLHEKEFGGGLSQLAKAKDPSLLPPPMSDDDVDNVFEGEVTDQRAM
ncbi:MAG: hypothetical protein GY822_13290 [Deltaproteobacteria bacterium]|nr:hypothetical protein [Deltaproteobacteria bacterium]